MRHWFIPFFILGVEWSVSDHSYAVSKALDRYGQALQAALAAGSQQVNKDLEIKKNFNH